MSEEEKEIRFLAEWGNNFRDYVDVIILTDEKGKFDNLICPLCGSIIYRYVDWMCPVCGYILVDKYVEDRVNDKLMKEAKNE